MTISSITNQFPSLQIEDNKSDFEEIISEELFIKIFQNLNVLALGRCGRVSKKFYRLTNDHSLWNFKQLISLEDFPDLMNAEKANYKDLYKELYLKRLVLLSLNFSRCKELVDKYQLKPSSSLSTLFKGLHEAFLRSPIDIHLTELSILPVETIETRNQEEIFEFIDKTWDSYDKDKLMPQDCLVKLFKPLCRLNKDDVNNYIDSKEINLRTHREEIGELCDFLVKGKVIEAIVVKLKTLKQITDTDYNEVGLVRPLFVIGDNLKTFRDELAEKKFNFSRLEAYINAFNSINIFFIYLKNAIESQNGDQLDKAKKILNSVREFIHAHRLSY